jgi:hypothetical protein
MSTRATILAALVAAGLLLSGAAPAAAQDAKSLSQKVAMTGKADNGRQFKGTYTIERFVRRGSRQFAVGTLKGRLAGRRVTRENVRIPVAVERAESAGASQLPNPTPGACQVLNLVLQPIELNLLGLRVATSRIELLIEAIPGAGNLLGNLLCGITGILDPQGSSGASPSLVTRLLNALLALVPRTA